MNSIGQTVKLWAALVALCACATSHHVTDEYRDSLGSQVKSTSRRTVILFLIDGLPAFTLQRELKESNLPQLQSYFVQGKNEMFLARTPFPSLTFPGIGSLLSEKPVDGHGIYGNQMYFKRDRVNFESPLDSKDLRAITQGQTIFARLHARGLKTVSIDYAFNADSDASVRLEDAEAALDIQNKQYEKVDNKLIKSLANLLNSTEAAVWPDFIFVHLVGVDFLTHDHGPDAPEVRKYLRALDANLKGVFSTLKKAEFTKKREVVALLTADHGVDIRVKSFLPIERVIKKVDPRIRVLNEGRYLTLFFPKSWGTTKKSAFMIDVVCNPEIYIVYFFEKSTVIFEYKDLITTLYFSPANCPESKYSIVVVPHSLGVMQTSASVPMCPENLDSATRQLYYPYFVSNLSHFFETPGHPDAVIIPKPGVTFKNNNYLGQHGGPTAREVFVPLLMRNATLGTADNIPALWELLRFME
jgi:hypothetical protein